MSDEKCKGCGQYHPVASAWTTPDGGCGALLRSENMEVAGVSPHAFALNVGLVLQELWCARRQLAQAKEENKRLVGEVVQLRLQIQAGPPAPKFPLGTYVRLVSCPSEISRVVPEEEFFQHREGCPTCSPKIVERPVFVMRPDGMYWHGRPEAYTAWTPAKGDRVWDTANACYGVVQAEAVEASWSGWYIVDFNGRPLHRVPLSNLAPAEFFPEKTEPAKRTFPRYFVFPGWADTYAFYRLDSAHEAVWVYRDGNARRSGDPDHRHLTLEHCLEDGQEVTQAEAITKLALWARDKLVLAGIGAIALAARLVEEPCASTANGKS